MQPPTVIEGNLIRSFYHVVVRREATPMPAGNLVSWIVCGPVVNNSLQGANGIPFQPRETKPPGGREYSIVYSSGNI